MPDSSQNPSVNPAISGRARRWVIHSVEVVRARLDQPTRDTLAHLKRAFRGAKPTDTVSNSMLFRRALVVYRQYVARLEEDPRQMETERLLLTQNTQLPKASKATEASPAKTPDEQ
jgi:hypothetical protein